MRKQESLVLWDNLMHPEGIRRSGVKSDTESENPERCHVDVEPETPNSRGQGTDWRERVKGMQVKRKEKGEN